MPEVKPGWILVKVNVVQVAVVEACFLELAPHICQTAMNEMLSRGSLFSSAMNSAAKGGPPLERNTFVVLRDRLVDEGVTVFTNSPVLETRGKGVYIAWEKELKFVPADTVILAVGMKSENGLSEALKGVVPELYSTGDCVKPDNALCH